MIYGTFVMAALAHAYFNFLEWLTVSKVGDISFMYLFIYIFISFYYILLIICHTTKFKMITKDYKND